METVQQNGRFTLFSSKFPSNIYSILYGYTFRLCMAYDDSAFKTMISFLSKIGF